MNSEIDAAWWVGAAIADHDTAVFAVTAGLGAGKTHGVCQWHYDRVLLNHRARFSCFVEPTYQKIHDAAIPTYQKVLGDFGLRNLRDYRIVKSPYPKIIFKRLESQHEVHFISAENPEMIIAVEYAHAAEDESGIISADVSNNVQTRLRDTNAECRQFFRSGAPQGITDFALAFDSDTLEGWDRSVDRDHTKVVIIEGIAIKYRRFQVWTDDNIANLPRDYIAKNIMAPFGHNPNYIQAYRYGKFVALVQGVVYSNYLPQKHDVDDIPADRYQTIYIDLDFNAEPLAWVASQILPVEVFSPTGRKRMFQNFYLQEANQGHGQLDDAAIEFEEKFPSSRYGNTPIKLYGDRSGHARSHKIHGSDFEAFEGYLKELGFKNVEICAAREVAPEAASADALNKLFLNGRAVVCRGCTNLRRSLQATNWKNGTRKIEKKQGETHTHHSDAVKYRAWQELREWKGDDIKTIYGKN